MEREEREVCSQETLEELKNGRCCCCFLKLKLLRLLFMEVEDTEIPNGKDRISLEIACVSLPTEFEILFSVSCLWCKNLLRNEECLNYN